MIALTVLILGQAGPLTATVYYEIVEAKRTQRSTFYVQSGPTSALIRQVQPSIGALDRSDITFWYGGELRAFDALNREYVSRRVNRTESPLVTLVAAAGLPVEPLATTLDPARQRTFLGRLQDRTAGKLAVQGNTWRWKGGTMTVKAAFESPKGRLTRVTVANKKARATWRVEYGPSRPVGELVEPAGARRVKSFVVGPALPKCDGATESALRRMLTAYRRIENLRIDQRGGPSLFVGPAALGQRQGNRKWLYEGGKLTFGSQTVPSRRSEVLDRVTNLGWSVDPILRDVLARQIPFASVLLPGSKARIAGQMKLNGADVTIVDITAPLRRVSVAIRDRDGLVASQSGTLLDGKGRVVSSTDQVFTYSPNARPTKFR